MSITHWIGAMRLAKGKKINKKVWEAASEGARTYGAEKKNKRQQLRYTHAEREREREFMRDQKKMRKSGGEMKRKTNKWNDAPYHGWPRVPSATWNYISKERIARGSLLIRALGLDESPVRKMLFPIRCGETALWQMHPSYTKEAIAAIIKYNVIQPTYTQAKAFRRPGGANSESGTEMCTCQCFTICARLFAEA